MMTDSQKLTRSLYLYITIAMMCFTYVQAENIAFVRREDILVIQNGTTYF
jgi:hypothetical protein